MQKQIIIKLHKSFENCTHDNDGVEFWYARELQSLLGYERWENFANAIEKAKIACENSKQSVLDHFRDVTKMVDIGSGAQKVRTEAKIGR